MELELDVLCSSMTYYRVYLAHIWGTVIHCTSALSWGTVMPGDSWKVLRANAYAYILCSHARA
jgi:hypothetical protein